MSSAADDSSERPLAQPRGGLDPFRILEYPAALFVINITLFTIIWKTIGVSWLPFGLGDYFQAVFTGGYYPRDMERNESNYNLLFLMMYGVLGTAAQVASVRIAMLRRKPHGAPGIWRWIFGIFHVAIAVYHVLFVFQFVKGKMILDGIASWQMVATQVLYVLELLMAIELLVASDTTFFRRKVCLDLLSACNLLPLLFYWLFAIAEFNDATSNRLVGYLFFAIAPLALMLVEWGTWLATAVPKNRLPNNLALRQTD